jgi:hypothetical protein
VVDHFLVSCRQYHESKSLGDIRSGATLRKAAPPPPKQRNARETSLDLIKSGGVQLKRAEPLPTKKATEQVIC